jgi:hypothetical protein
MSRTGRWSPLGTKLVWSTRGVAVLLEEIDDNDENVWLSEVGVEESDERLPRCVEGTTVCVNALDREDHDDHDEQDGAGEQDRGDDEVEVGSGTILNGCRVSTA